MDNKQIEEAIRIKLAQASSNPKEQPTDQQIYDMDKTFVSLAQLLLSVKGVPSKAEIPETRIATPLCEISYNKGRIQGRNQCHDEFTVWLVGRCRKIEETIRNFNFTTNDFLHNLKPPYDNKLSEGIAKDLATAIKTMILGGEK